MRLAVTLVVLLAFCAPASAERKESAMVAVTAPDENGQSVAIDTDVRLPVGAAPKRGWPLVALFHGGGGTKSGEFDSKAAAAFTAHGYATILYSARGHGASGGQTTVAGPKEIRDAFDVLNWAIAKYPLDRKRIALWGYSQGGLHTNLAQAWSRDRELNPERLRFRALMPSSTPDKVFDALIDHNVVKLSFGVALVALYSTSARPAPQVDRWIATAAADQPAAFGAGGDCDTSGHDTPTSTLKADLAWRSMGCRPQRLGLPTFWLQQFDDALFPVHMAAHTMRVRRHRYDRLTLGTGGHAAPSASNAHAAEVLDRQITWLGAVLRHRRPPGPRVVYYARDPAVTVPYATRQWPDGAWVRRTARRWPPRVVRVTRVAVPDATLAGTAADPQHDSAATGAAAAIPNGTTITGALPALETPGAATEVRAPVLTGEVAGRPVLRGTWTPLSPDSQVDIQLLDEAPDGTLTFLSRGAFGIRGALPGQPLRVTVRGTAIAVLVRPGHRLLLRVAAADASFYKPFAGALGGTLADAELRVPVRRGARGWRCWGCSRRPTPCASCRPRGTRPRP